MMGCHFLIVLYMYTWNKCSFKSVNKTLYIIREYIVNVHVWIKILKNSRKRIQVFR